MSRPEHRPNRSPLPPLVAGLLLSVLLAPIFALTAAAETTTTHDSGPWTTQTSVAITTDDRPVMAWTEFLGVNVTICADPSCSTTNGSLFNEVSDPAIAMALYSDDRPVIAFADYHSSGDGVSVVGLASCVDTPCTSVTSNDLDIVDSYQFRAQPSVAVRSEDDRAVVAYRDGNRVKVAICGDADCTTSSITTVTTSGGGRPVLQLTPDGRPVIAFWAPSLQNHITLIVCEDRDCATTSTTTIETEDRTVPNVPPSLTLTSTGLPVIAHGGQHPWVVLCEDVACSSSTTTVVDAIVGPKSVPAVTVTSDDRPVISYQDTLTIDLRVAVCADPRCTSITSAAIDTAGTGGAGSSVAVTGDDQPVVAHIDRFNSETRLTICDNPTCDSASDASTSAGDGGYECPTAFTLDLSTSSPTCTQALETFGRCPLTHELVDSETDATCVRTIYATLIADRYCQTGESSGTAGDKVCTTSYRLYDTCPDPWVLVQDYTSSNLPPICQRTYSCAYGTLATSASGVETCSEPTPAGFDPETGEYFCRSDQTLSGSGSDTTCTRTFETQESFVLQRLEEDPRVCDEGFTEEGTGRDTMCVRSIAGVGSGQFAESPCPAYGYDSSGSGPDKTCTPRPIPTPSASGQTDCTGCGPSTSLGSNEPASSCPAGYVTRLTAEGRTCTRTVPATESTSAIANIAPGSAPGGGATSYSCPAGYVSSGTGAGKTCTRTIMIAGPPVEVLGASVVAPAAAPTPPVPVRMQATAPPAAPASTPVAVAVHGFGEPPAFVQRAAPQSATASTQPAAAQVQPQPALAHTGAEHEPIAYLALGLIAIGSIFMAVRRQSTAMER